MPNSAYERLKITGSFGLDVSIHLEMSTIDLGGGRRRSRLYGTRSGLRAWKLVYKVLPGTMDGAVETDLGELEAQADYLWNLFLRSKTGYDDIDRPIIITCLRDGKDYLVCFKDNSLTYTLFMTKLYATGIELVQTTRPDVNTLADGSLGAPTEGVPEI
jgi:hypothetical protein